MRPQASAAIGYIYLLEAVLQEVPSPDGHGMHTRAIADALELKRPGNYEIVLGVAQGLEAAGLIEDVRFSRSQGSLHLWRRCD